MKVEEARVGVRVKSLADFSGVPKGTVGTIVEDYGSGFMVLWERYPNDKLRDGFDKEIDIQFLEAI